jgi:hypothetical protein
MELKTVIFQSRIRPSQVEPLLLFDPFGGRQYLRRDQDRVLDVLMSKIRATRSCRRRGSRTFGDRREPLVSPCRFEKD